MEIHIISVLYSLLNQMSICMNDVPNYSKTENFIYTVPIRMFLSSERNQSNVILSKFYFLFAELYAYPENSES